MVIIALSNQMSWELPQSWDSLYMVHTGKYRNTLGFYSFQHNPLRLCSRYRSDPERVSSDADQTEPYAHKKHPSLWSPQAWEAQAISFSLQPLPTPWLPVCKLPGHREKLLQNLVFVFLSCSIIAAWWCYEVRGMSRPRAWQNTGALLYVSSAMVKTLQDIGTVKGRYRYPLRFQPHLGFAQLILQHCPGAEGTAQMQIQQLWIPCSVVILRLHTWTQIDL